METTNKNLIVSIVFILVALAVGYFSLNSEVKIKRSTVSIGGQLIEVDLAQTPAQTAKGLSGREMLQAGEGMLFVFDKFSRHTFWMKDMLFSIDIIWINQDKVVHFVENASPESFPNVFVPEEEANYVLEVQAGFVKKYGVQKGDTIEINLK